MTNFACLADSFIDMIEIFYKFLPTLLKLPIQKSTVWYKLFHLFLSEHINNLVCCLVYYNVIRLIATLNYELVQLTHESRIILYYPKIITSLRISDALQLLVSLRLK